MCDQLDEEPDPEVLKKLPDFDDFPYDVQQAIQVFGKLADKVVADIGYLGKDYTALPVHMEVANIENKDIFLEALLRLDQNVIEKSAERMKQERKKHEKK